MITSRSRAGIVTWVWDQITWLNEIKEPLPTSLGTQMKALYKKHGIDPASMYRTGVDTKARPRRCWGGAAGELQDLCGARAPAGVGSPPSASRARFAERPARRP
jgi:hypothetical protein